MFRIFDFFRDSLTVLFDVTSSMALAGPLIGKKGLAMYHPKFTLQLLQLRDVMYLLFYSKLSSALAGARKVL